jgi:chromosome segregation ATPase
MKNKEYNPETVQKKLEDLDNEVNTFIQVIREVKDMKGSAERLQEKLIRHEGEIEQQKQELAQLISTTQNLGMNIEEQTKGVIYDLEMKTDALILEVKAGISQLSSLYEKGSSQIQEQRPEHLENLSNKYDEIKKAYEKIKIMVDSHEQRINSLNNSYAGAPNLFDKMESSLNEMKKNVYELQKRPSEIDNKLIKMEERMEASINEKYSRQKNLMLVILIILIAVMFFSVVMFYFS